MSTPVLTQTPPPTATGGSRSTATGRAVATVTDFFAGAGGTTQGAAVVDGVKVVLAANHSSLAMQSHASNFPDVEHDVADLSQVEPRRYRRTNILWGSPECTWQSGARGVRRDDHYQLDLFAQGRRSNELAERSRATMFDVHRFNEYHRYDAIVVENVVEAASRWPMWRSWLLGFDDLGYQVEVVCANSMHFPSGRSGLAPQSRDRLYVVAWPKGRTAPDLALRPPAWCDRCEREVRAMQAWKRHDRPRIGKYRAQYVYRCPHRECRHSVVEPYVAPAAAAIDWTRRGQRIGDRSRPLSENTMRRIRIGLARFASGTTEVPESRAGAWPGVDAALVVPYYGTGVAFPASEPLHTVPTRDRFRLAFVAELRGGGSTARSVRDPLATISTSGNNHRLVVPPVEVPDVMDCTSRMLGIDELKAAMGFRPGYQVLGRDEDVKMQIGNAVTPCASEFLISAVATTLTPAA